MENLRTAWTMLQDPLENEDVEANSGEHRSVVLPDSGAA